MSIDVDAINKKIDHLHLIIEGNDKQGIEGLVPMLKRHMAESSENFKAFKRDVVKDWINENVRLEKEVAELKKKVVLIEEKQTSQFKTFGYLTSASFVGGTVLGFLLDKFL